MKNFNTLLDTISFKKNERNPQKKTKQWAENVATAFRTYWTPLINPKRATICRQVMYGQDSIEHIKKSFQDEEFKNNTVFAPIPILESFVNAIVEEITQQPPRTEVKAQDPLSIIGKEEDIQLLKSRKILEGDISRMQRGIGLPNYKVPYNEFNGNVEEFDDMQLDENDPEDVDVFKANFHKLWYEIGAQAALNAIIKNNDFDAATLRTMVKDAFAYKACASSCYVDQVTGEIKYKYIDPSLLMGIWGKTNDGRDDIVRGWYDGVTVNEWLSMAGEEFDFEKDWTDLLCGINFHSGSSYTGFERGTKVYSCISNTDLRDKMGIGKDVVKDNLINWNNAYQFKIYVGYMEWPSWEATSTFKYSPDGDVCEVDYDYELTKAENTSGYIKKSKFQQLRYRMYFLATSPITQSVCGFQKVYFQNLEGVYDEYSKGTISYYQEQGQSAVELSMSFLNIANFAYYRFLWLIWHTKPIAEEYVLDEILTLAKSIQRETQQTNGTKNLPGLDTLVQQAIQAQRQGHYRLRVFPKVEGKTIPQLPPNGRRNGDGGVDPTTIVMQSITEWAEARISRIIGFNPMRIGANPPSRESLKTEENTLAASQNATGYMYRMIQYIKKQLAVSSLNYITDIVQYPDTIAYKWLEKMLGERTFGYLKFLDKTAGHRVGIFVSDMNLSVIKQRTMQAADLALGKGLITLPQWNILYYMEDPKMANARLSIMQRQSEKRMRRELMELENLKHQNAMQFEQAKQQTASIPAQAQIQSAQIGGSAQVESARIQSQGRIAVKEAQIAAEPEKQRSKTEGSIILAETENNLKNQQPITFSQQE